MSVACIPIPAMQESWNKHFDKFINYVKALSVGGAILYLLKQVDIF